MQLIQRLLLALFWLVCFYIFTVHYKQYKDSIAINRKLTIETRDLQKIKSTTTTQINNKMDNRHNHNNSDTKVTSATKKNEKEERKIKSTDFQKIESTTTTHINNKIDNRYNHNNSDTKVTAATKKNEKEERKIKSTNFQKIESTTTTHINNKIDNRHNQNNSDTKVTATKNKEKEERKIKSTDFQKVKSTITTQKKTPFPKKTKTELPNSSPKFDRFLRQHPVFGKYNISVVNSPKKKVTLLLIVSTAPRRADRRASIRDTWWKQCVGNEKVKEH